MLSTQYRLRLEFICSRIVKGEPIELGDRIWATKLGEVNRTAATLLRQAQRRAANPEMDENGLDSFLNDLDLGGIGHEARGIRGFESPQDVVDFFRRDECDDWRQRD